MSTAIKTPFENFKNIKWGEVLAILAVILSVGAWCLIRIDRQFDRFDKQFDRIEETLKRIERDNREFHGRLAYLEGKMDIQWKVKEEMEKI